ncbi:MAG: SRPBCC domain-containing protein [Flavobacteriales bacterium]|nr:SRPBCC domain-containing protein [Flavobacteriales bacterium]
MKKIETEIVINANVESVWQILIDFENYKNWNPFITKITKRGTSHLDIQLNTSEDKNMKFKPKILKLIKDSELRWKGHLFFSGIFDGEHVFRMETIGQNKTRFIHEESFSGLLSGLIFKSIGSQTKANFIAMNEALKREAEK